VAVQLRRTLWRLAEVIEVVPETPRTKSLLLEVPEWEGHKAGKHVDVSSLLRMATRPSAATP
jgi:ferredoxin-NADP reductase